MAHDSKCYCCHCEKKEISGTYLYCYECVKALENMFVIFTGNKAGFRSSCVNIIENPPFAYHCIKCGGHENRRINYDKLTICDQCIKEELSQYEQERTK